MAMTVLSRRHSRQSLVVGVWLAFVLLLAVRPSCIVKAEDPASASTAGARPADVTASLVVLDVDGRVVDLGATTRPTAIVFLANECPLANKYIPELNRLAAEFRAAGADLYGVLFERDLDRAAAAKHLAEFRVEFPMLFDTSGELVERFQPRRTPEAFVVDGKGAIVYRGRIDDGYVDVGRPRARVTSHDLADAVRAVLAGEAIAAPATEPVGCPIETPRAGAAPAEVTFCREIAPILWGRCVECHRAGQVAPFALDSYASAAKRAEHLVEVTRSRYMPPWKADPSVGHFVGDRRMADRELDLLERWAAAGAPQGNAADLPPLPEFHDDWQLGEPDLVLEMPEECEIPADGENVFRWFAIPVNLPADRMVAAVEFRPGNARVVHHSLMFFDVTGAAKRLDARDPRPGYENFGGPGFLPAGFLGSWAPGFSSHFLPEGTGIWLPRPSVIALQMHYFPTGKVERDRSRIGLHFVEATRAVHPVTTVPVMNNLFEIPAGEAAHTVNAAFTLPVDCTVIALNPHMHYVGQKMRIAAVSPTGERRPLIAIDDWDFNWQDWYQLREGIPLAKGTTLEVEAVYNNTADNPRNPHSPPEIVRYGQNTTDEMCLAGVQIVVHSRRELVDVAGALIRAYLTKREGQPFISPFE